MTFININNHIASINNNLSICDSAKCNKMIDILNKDILPFITYNSNLVYGIEYSSNVLYNDYYGWYDIPSTNSNMILIPNIIYNTIDISSNQYSSEFINLPSYNDFILPDIYAPILNTHTGKHCSKGLDLCTPTLSRSLFEYLLFK